MTPAEKTRPPEMSSEAISPKIASELISVSVGNIAFGGRGKTPTVALVARVLRDAGERVAILSRGYGRRVVEDGVVVVSDGTHLLADLDRAGDEPLMLARELPGVSVLVCDQRAVAGALAQHVLGATALVLDDGFQHRQMRRDVDLVLVAPDDLTGRRAPLGRLREAPSALARADVLVVDGENELGGDFDRNRLRARFRGPVYHLRRNTRPPALPAGARVFVLAGIAGPARVVRAAADAGFVVAGHWAPGDHHRYTRADVARIAWDIRALSDARDLRALSDARDLRAAGAARDPRAVGAADAATSAAPPAPVALVTTAKDAERLRPSRPLPFDVHVLAHTVTLEPADPSGGTPPFADWLRARIAATREARGTAHPAPRTAPGAPRTAHPAPRTAGEAIA